MLAHLNILTRSEHCIFTSYVATETMRLASVRLKMQCHLLIAFSAHTHSSILPVYGFKNSMATGSTYLLPYSSYVMQCMQCHIIRSRCFALLQLCYGELHFF